MRILATVAIMMAIGGCTSGQDDDRVMIALVIENEMNRHVLSSNIEFIPESGVHTFGNIASGRSAGNLGFRVNALPTTMNVNFWIASKPGISPMMVDANTAREKVVRTVKLFEPEMNPNLPEFHLVIRPDGSIEQVLNIDLENAAQLEASEETAGESKERLSD